MWNLLLLDIFNQSLLYLSGLPLGAMAGPAAVIASAGCFLAAGGTCMAWIAGCLTMTPLPIPWQNPCQALIFYMIIKDKPIVIAKRYFYTLTILQRMLYVRPLLTLSLSALVFLIVQRIPEEERNAPTVASCILSACGGSLALGAEIGNKHFIKEKTLCCDKLFFQNNKKKYIFSWKLCQHVPRWLRGHCSSISDWMCLLSCVMSSTSIIST